MYKKRNRSLLINGGLALLLEHEPLPIQDRLLLGKRLTCPQEELVPEEWSARRDIHGCDSRRELLVPPLSDEAGSVRVFPSHVAGSHLIKVSQPLA